MNVNTPAQPIPHSRITVASLLTTPDAPVHPAPPPLPPGEVFRSVHPNPTQTRLLQQVMEQENLPPHPLLAHALESLAKVSLLSGEPVVAEKLLVKSLAMRVSEPTPDLFSVARGMKKLGGISAMRNRHAEAARRFSDAFHVMDHAMVAALENMADENVQMANSTTENTQ